MSNAVHETDSKNTVASKPPLDPHLKALENEAIHIFREVAAEFDKPVMLYSIGKDSSVLLHLARKAFFPGRIPFPLLHVNTGWKFKEMIEFRDNIVKEYDLELISHTNPRGAAENITPFTHGSALYTDIMKTEALRQALDAGQFDAAVPRNASTLSVRPTISGTRATSGRNCGTSITAWSARAKACAPSRSPTGPKWISGVTSKRKTFLWCRSITPLSAPISSATA